MSLARADHPRPDVAARAAGAAPDRRSPDEAVDTGRRRRGAHAFVLQRAWMPSARELVIALLLGAGAGTIAALWVTLMEAVGIVLSLGS